MLLGLPSIIVVEDEGGEFSYELDFTINSAWPGNIRQVENVIRSYVIFDSEYTLLAHASRSLAALNTPPAVSQPVSLKEATGRATREVERRLILETLTANQWHRKKTAEALHISYRALLYKMKQSGLPMKTVHQATNPEESDR